MTTILANAVLPKNKVHVYFYALPIGTKFVHKGEQWKKTAEEKAVDGDGKEWRFEVHYGCILSKAKADEMKIKKKDYRPLN